MADVTSNLSLLHVYGVPRDIRHGKAPSVWHGGFKYENEFDDVKSGIKHLLYGEGDTIKRMADLIYDKSYKLHQFSQSYVQELVGWINNE